MFILKVSLPGFDVNTASPEECVIDSRYNTPKIDVQKGNFQSFQVNFNNEPPDPTSAGTSTETIIYQREHGYDYVPQTWVECDYTATFGTFTFPVYGPGTAGLGAVSAFDATFFGVRCDSKYLYLYVLKGSSALDNSVLHIAGTSLRCRVYIFAENGAEAP